MYPLELLPPQSDFQGINFLRKNFHPFTECYKDMKNLLENMRNDVDENSNSPGKWTISPVVIGKKARFLGQKIENSWFSPKNTGDL
jgi:hypothetical protein